MQRIKILLEESCSNSFGFYPERLPEQIRKKYSLLDMFAGKPSSEISKKFRLFEIDLKIMIQE
jgi:hypothetical protein